MAGATQRRDQIRAPLIRSAVLLAVAFVAMGSAMQWRSTAEAALANTVAHISYQRQAWQRQARARSLTAQYSARYQALQQTGLFDSLSTAPQRARASALAVGVTAVDVEMMRTDTPEDTNHVPLGAQLIRMRLKLELTHEGQLQQFFAHLEQSEGAPFGVEQCDLTRSTVRVRKSAQALLSVECELLWMTLLAGQSEEAL